jgi:hypothetical protein
MEVERARDYVARIESGEVNEVRRQARLSSEWVTIRPGDRDWNFEFRAMLGKAQSELVYAKQELEIQRRRLAEWPGPNPSGIEVDRAAARREATHAEPNIPPGTPIDTEHHVPHGRGVLPKTMLDQIRLRSVAKIGGYSVWTVDGEAIRNRVHIDFTTGGNPGRYTYVPEGEVWVEKVLTPTDMSASLLHELVETVLMEQARWSYDDAHEAASGVEKALRSQLIPESMATVVRRPSVHAAMDVAKAWFSDWRRGKLLKLGVTSAGWGGGVFGGMS